MSRGLSTAFKDALGSGVIYPAMFAEFQFKSATTRFWTGETSITTDLGDGSVTWTGGGLLGAVETSGESEKLASRKMSFTLNGVDTSYYATAVVTDYNQRPVKLWFALMNSAFTTVSYSYLMEEARMDILAVDDAAETITLKLDCESRLVDLFTPRRVYLNNEDLQREYPTHTFYRYIPTLSGKRMPWGMLVSTSSSGSGVAGVTQRPDLNSRP